jgi:hypothetical protein
MKTEFLGMGGFSWKHQQNLYKQIAVQTDCNLAETIKSI